MSSNNNNNNNNNTNNLDYLFISIQHFNSKVKNVIATNPAILIMYQNYLIAYIINRTLDNDEYIHH